MNYIDTNVILSYLNKRDVNYHKAFKLWSIKEQKVISEVTLLEIRSVLARTTKLNEQEIEAYIEYLPETGVKIAEGDLYEIFRRAPEVAFKLKMKMLDTLHIAACLEINAGSFTTLDHGFIEKSKVISEFGITIVWE